MNKKTEKIFLSDLKEGQKGIVVSIFGGRGAIKRLADLGLSSQTEVKVLRKALRGPIQVEVMGSRLVLGRGLASKILVKVK